jgi:transposase
MSDAEWALAQDLLPVPGWLAGRGGGPEGYCHRQMIDAVRLPRLGVVLDIVRRSDDVQGFQVLPRRWVVERSFAWFLRSRRLVRDYERHTDTMHRVHRILPPGRRS